MRSFLKDIEAIKKKKASKLFLICPVKKCVLITIQFVKEKKHIIQLTIAIARFKRDFN